MAFIFISLQAAFVFFFYTESVVRNGMEDGSFRLNFEKTNPPD